MRAALAWRCGGARLPRAPRAAARAASTLTGTEAVPFALTRAPQVFSELQAWWARSCPGLAPPKWGWPKPVFLPHWIFELDVKIPAHGIVRTGFVGPSTVLYSGASYPRSMVDVLKCDLRTAQPFRGAMLQLGDGAMADVEPFELFESTAWTLVRASFLAREASLLAPTQRGDAGGAPFGHDAFFSNVRSHRVLLPAWVVTYPYLFETFRVYVNAHSGEVAGVQQYSPLASLARLTRTLDARDLSDKANSFVRVLEKALTPKQLLALLNGGLLLARPLLKVLLWPPLLVASAATLGAFALSRATRSHRQQAAELAAWEEQRAHERRLQATMSDEWRFKPQGESAWERDAARRREEEASERARQARVREQQQQQPQQQQQQSAKAQPRAAPKAEPSSARAGGGAAQQQQRRRPLPPPVDAADFYAVLGLQPHASEDDVKAAFRRELMRYHPDHQGEDDGFDAQGCSDRTRAIIAAYSTLRDEHRRRKYDASYRPSRRR